MYACLFWFRIMRGAHMERLWCRPWKDSRSVPSWPWSGWVLAPHPSSEMPPSHGLPGSLILAPGMSAKRWPQITIVLLKAIAYKKQAYWRYEIKWKVRDHTGVLMYVWGSGKSGKWLGIWAGCVRFCPAVSALGMTGGFVTGAVKISITAIMTIWPCSSPLKD